MSTHCLIEVIKILQQSPDYKQNEFLSFGCRGSLANLAGSTENVCKGLEQFQPGQHGPKMTFGWHFHGHELLYLSCQISNIVLKVFHATDRNLNIPV